MEHMQSHETNQATTAHMIEDLLATRTKDLCNTVGKNPKS